jgi:hypothetical protein
MFCEFFGERGGIWFLAVFRELELIRCIVSSCYDFSYGSPNIQNTALHGTMSGLTINSETWFRATRLLVF